ncbi:MAG: Na(+)-translocating NADH-quinone reductase subunit A [Flavobacteriales bacterium]|nr:Na(+)-translocating NADH-quinone reductase subunit A [Flavobacteriales bacterium]
MSKVIKIKKGKDINLVGVAQKSTTKVSSPTYAVKPTDFKNFVPKLEVKAGAEVKAGDVLFHDKTNEAIKFTSPVSGEVAEIVRGDRRAVLEVRILADSEMKYKSFNIPTTLNAENVKAILLSSGLWPFIIQRPFGIIAHPDATPKSIHISCFDSAPLAADFDYTLANEADSFAKGVEVLKNLTSGKIHLNVSSKNSKPSFISKTQGVEITEFSGPHPAGLVGVQIHHIDPINKGDVVWTLNPQHVVFIGRLFATGKVDLRQIIAVAGSDVSKPAYVEVISGTSLEPVLKGNLSGNNSRIISGNVLTGTKISANSHLGFFDNLVTAIPEGDEYEFMGWLLPTYPRPTISNSLPISKFLKKTFKVNTNYHGEERAYVVTGQYEKVLPMDILPVYLIKAIMAQDLEAMENLGIYEVIEEDLALCEFVCTSKMEVQKILSEGLTIMAEEG